MLRRLLLATILPAALLTAQEPKIPERAFALTSTFKSLQETLAAIGRVNSIFHYTDDKTAARWTANYDLEISNVHASPQACRLDYDSQHITNHVPGPKQHMWAWLHQPWGIWVRTGEQAAKEEDARTGHPQWTAQIEPSTFIVTLQGPSHIVFPFKDEPAALHAAKLLASAIELCGGGEPPEPGLGPIPPPAEDLRAAMLYLDYQLGAYGPVNYLVLEAHNRQVRAVNWTTEVTDFRANPQTCRIDFHERVAWDGNLVSNRNVGAALKDVRQIMVTDQTHRLKRMTLSRQHANVDFKVEPEVYVIDVMTENRPISLRTYDQDLAMRLARVIQHATELCGGGPQTVY